MLETYCNSLSDEAQLKIAVRLGKMALPVWSNYFQKKPEAINSLNVILSAGIPVKGAAKQIDVEFPQRALEKIERSYLAAREQSINNPVPVMKSDATLTPMLATCMQMLTNKNWESTLTQPVRLVFTLVFNILVWILYRRTTPFYETHIYVAINQASDVLLSENILSNQDWSTLLYEYEDQVRRIDEDNLWEKAFRVGESEPLDREDVFLKILGEPVNKDLCGPRLAKEILRQMREEGKSYWNRLEEFNTGTSTTYSYNAELQSYARHEMDVIVGSFSRDVPMKESEMQLAMARQTLTDLRQSGFEI